ncbi:hypothetical protein B7P00_17270 [Bordetella bronchiseptica]|nr:hypothetical protein B7P00_17270 [Bordetella bronchiseptica]
MAMAHDQAARYDGERDGVDFRCVPVRGGPAIRAFVSAEALTDHFRCHDDGPSLLACYEVHWQRLHDAACRLAERGQDPVIVRTQDL